MKRVFRAASLIQVAHARNVLLTAGIGMPYDPMTGKGVVGKNYCHQTTSNVMMFVEDETRAEHLRGAIPNAPPLVALTVLFGERPVPFYVLIPLVGWSRVYLRAHTLLQVVAGTVLALVTTLLFFHIFRIV